MFFVKYNDPIYVKLEKLDIMIRLASQANIAQVAAVAPCWFVGVCWFACDWSVLPLSSPAGAGRAEGVRH